MIDKPISRMSDAEVFDAFKSRVTDAVILDRLMFLRRMLETARTKAPAINNGLRAAIGLLDLFAAGYGGPATGLRVDEILNLRDAAQPNNRLEPNRVVEFKPKNVGERHDPQGRQARALEGGPRFLAPTTRSVAARERHRKHGGGLKPSTQLMRDYVKSLREGATTNHANVMHSGFQGATYGDAHNTIKWGREKGYLANKYGDLVRTGFEAPESADHSGNGVEHPVEQAMVDVLNGEPGAAAIGMLEDFTKACDDGLDGPWDPMNAYREEHAE